MGRTIVLRKCGEHEDCSLQAIDGAEWEHTPTKRRLAERIGPPPAGLLEAKLTATLARTDELAEVLAERGTDAADLLRELRDSAAALAWVKHEAPTLAQLSDTVRNLKDTAATLAWLREAAPTVARLSDMLHQAHDLATALTEKKGAVDVLHARLAEGIEHLEELTRSFHELDAKTARKLVADQGLELEAMRAEIAHEREERLEATRKTARQVRTLAERIEKR